MEEKPLASGPVDLFARIDNAGFEESLLSEGILTTTLGNAINWARKNSYSTANSSSHFVADCHSIIC